MDPPPETAGDDTFDAIEPASSVAVKLTAKELETSAWPPPLARSALDGTVMCDGSLLSERDTEPPRAGLMLLSDVAFWPSKSVMAFAMTNSTPVLGSISTVCALK